MMVLKAKLEISCSSITFIKEVFALDERITKYSIINLHCQSTMAAPGPVPVRGVVVDRPQAVAAAWRAHVGARARCSRARVE